MPNSRAWGCKEPTPGPTGRAEQLARGLVLGSWDQVVRHPGRDKVAGARHGVERRIMVGRRRSPDYQYEPAQALRPMYIQNHRTRLRPACFWLN